MKKWEYNVVYWDAAVRDARDAFGLNDALNEYGIDGWEVVSMSHQVDSWAQADNGGVSSIETTGFIIVMKKEIED